MKQRADALSDWYVSSSGNYAIEVFTPEGLGRVFATKGTNVPNGLALGASGDLYADGSFV